MKNIEIPDDLIQKIITVHGERGNEWLAKLPEIIHKYQQLWNLSILTLVTELSYNFVAHAQSNNTLQKLIFKAVVPSKQFEAEIYTLEYFAGHGCVKLLNYSIEDGVMLLEEADPGTTLAEYSRNGRDDEAVIVCSDLIRILHAKPLLVSKLQAPTQFLHDLFDDFKDIKAKELKDLVKNTNTSFELPMFLRAEQEYADLLASTKTTVLLHGDLHHFNILKSTRENWLSIDPHGIVGDPAFEVAAFMRNPYPGVLKLGNMRKIMQRRIDIFAEQLGFEKSRIWRWSFAQNILSAGWMLQDNIDNWQEIYEVCKILLDIESNNT